MRCLPSMIPALFALSVSVQAATPAPDEAAESPLANRPERLEWLQDAGFGMFIHWSLDSQIGSVISHSLVGASDEYTNWFINELPKTFQPKRWDADEVAALAKLCGMKYVVLTAKHHSGFCLWDTKTTDFNIMNTPHGKDVLRDYVSALRRQGLAVGLYYSPEDFAWLYRHGHPVRRRNLEPHPDVDRDYADFIRRQVTELFTDYGAIDVLFIDGEGSVPTKEVAWRLQPNCLITRGAMETPEQYVPGRPPEGPWEANLTMGTQWQYKPTNDEYKSATRMIEILIETRAKGGTLLLNVGPKPNGELPKEQDERLREIALWHAVNAAAVHETRPWVVANEEDVWFTRGKDTNVVYAFLTRQAEWPRGQRRTIRLQSVRATEATQVRVLGQNDRVVEYAPGADATSRWTQTDDGLEVSIVRAQRLYNDHRWHNPLVIRLENVEPALTDPPFAVTGSASATDNGQTAFQGELRHLGGAESVEVGFEYQTYGGFATAMHNTKWTRTTLQRRDAPGKFSSTVSGLEPGQTYQYRAIVKHPKIIIRGDHLQWLVK